MVPMRAQLGVEALPRNLTIAALPFKNLRKSRFKGSMREFFRGILSLMTEHPGGGTRLGERGFSLIEIMVAVSLLAAIIIGLLAMFYHVQRAFRSGVAQADVMEGGRATMSLLVRELQEMTACQVDFVTNCLIAPALGVTPTFQDLPSGSARSNFLQDICFLSRVNDDWIGTGYRVDNAVSGVGTLYRLVDRWSGDTLPTLNSQSLSNHSALLCNSTTANTNYHRVLDGVVSLTITPYDTNGLLYFNTNGADLLINHAARVYGFAKDALPA